jgi:hypothetical protein
MTVLQIDGRTETAWRCELRTMFPPMTFERERSVEGPDSLMTTVYGRVTYYLEVLLTSQVLQCWTPEHFEASQLTGIDTKGKTLKLVSGKCPITGFGERALTAQEQTFVQQERLIESNNAIAASLRARKPRPARKKVPATPAPSSPPVLPAKVAVPLPPPEINETLLWHVQQKIVDELDTTLKSAPSASVVFTLYCRDRLTLAKISRRHQWPYRTLKLRKAALENFLGKHFNNITLADFFVDRAIFRAAERQLKEHRGAVTSCSWAVKARSPNPVTRHLPETSSNVFPLVSMPVSCDASKCSCVQHCSTLPVSSTSR